MPPPEGNNRLSTNFHGEAVSFREGIVSINTTWWFQPIWRILVKLEIFPQVGVKIKRIETTTQYSIINTVVAWVLKLW